MAYSLKMRKQSTGYGFMATWSIYVYLICEFSLSIILKKLPLILQIIIKKAFLFSGHPGILQVYEAKRWRAELLQIYVHISFP